MKLFGRPNGDHAHSHQGTAAATKADRPDVSSVRTSLRTVLHQYDTLLEELNDQRSRHLDDAKDVQARIQSEIDELQQQISSRTKALEEAKTEAASKTRTFDSEIEELNAERDQLKSMIGKLPDPANPAATSAKDPAAGPKTTQEDSTSATDTVAGS